MRTLIQLPLPSVRAHISSLKMNYCQVIFIPGFLYFGMTTELIYNRINLNQFCHSPPFHKDPEFFTSPSSY